MLLFPAVRQLHVRSIVRWPSVCQPPGPTSCGATTPSGWCSGPRST